MQLSREEEAGAVLQGLRLLVHGLRVTSHSVERDHGLSGAQLFVLRELSTEPGISVRSLSERTMTDPSSVSVVVARLVERGLVSRDQDQADRRCNVLCVTASGRRLLKRAPVPYQEKLFAALSGLPRTRLRQLRLGLSALLEGASAGETSAPLFFEDVLKTRSGGRRGTKRA